MILLTGGGVIWSGGGCLLGGVSAPRGTAPGWRGVCWGGVPGGDPPGMATAAGGAHPTGMHSCWSCL